MSLLSVYIRHVQLTARRLADPAMLKFLNAVADPEIRHEWRRLYHREPPRLGIY
jgi:hypothetical protein